MGTLEAIRGRRSVKEYRRTKVPDDVLLEILDAAGWAPCAGNLFNTRIIVVEDPALKAMIAKAATQDFIATAPVVMVVCSDGRQLKQEFGERGVDWYARQNTAAAIQNLLLAAESFGVGSCWVGAFAETKIRSRLNIKDFLEIHAIATFGYPARKPAPKRNIIADVYTTWDKFASIEPKNPRQRAGKPGYYPERLVDKAQKWHAQLKERIEAMKRKKI